MRPISPASALVEAYRDVAARLRARPRQGIDDMRDTYDGLHRITAEPEGVCYSEAEVGGIRVLWCVPHHADDRYVLLYVHGGGFQLGSIALYRKLVGHIAAAAGIPALVFEYRLAPEHPYPAQLEDTAAIQRWLAAKGISPDCSVVVGDSAGANLAAAHVLRSIRAGGPAPAGIIAMSPWFDLTLDSRSICTRRAVDVAVSRSGLLAMREAYLARGPLPDDPCVSPLYADLTGLPPTLLLTGEHEILLDDTVQFAGKACAAGVSVEMKIYASMPHVFALLAGRTREADEVVARAGGWARERLELQPRPQQTDHIAKQGGNSA
jgi:monoterpene epsilon-lactone hydrolase